MSDKILDNFARLLVFCVVLPMLFAVVAPATRSHYYERSDRAIGPLTMFQDRAYFRDLSDIVERLSEHIGYEVSHIYEEELPDEVHEANQLTLAEQVWELVVDSGAGSLLGGLVVMFVFSVWKPFTEWSGVWTGIVPIFPGAAAAYVACMLMTIEGQETFIRDLMYILATANFCLLLLRSQSRRTSAVWQLIKGIFLFIMACAVSAGFMAIYCMYTMLDIDRLQGQSAYVTLFSMSFVTGVIIVIYDLFSDAAERSGHVG